MEDKIQKQLTKYMAQIRQSLNVTKHDVLP
jgi:hypothetical protein